MSWSPSSRRAMGSAQRGATTSRSSAWRKRLRPRSAPPRNAHEHALAHARASHYPRPGLSCGPEFPGNPCLRSGLDRGGGSWFDSPRSGPCSLPTSCVCWLAVSCWALPCSAGTTATAATPTWVMLMATGTMRDTTSGPRGFRSEPAFLDLGRDLLRLGRRGPDPGRNPCVADSCAGRGGRRF
jgi:hypothetical protein